MKKLKPAELSQEPTVVNQVVSSEIRVVLTMPAPTPTLTADSREGIIERPQPSKTSARIGSFKEADNDEALPNDILKGLFFQDWKTVQ